MEGDVNGRYCLGSAIVIAVELPSRRCCSLAPTGKSACQEHYIKKISRPNPFTNEGLVVLAHPSDTMLDVLKRDLTRSSCAILSTGSISIRTHGAEIGILEISSNTDSLPRKIFIELNPIFFVQPIQPGNSTDFRRCKPAAMAVISRSDLTGCDRRLRSPRVVKLE
jgi:hypothetical protein